MSNRPLTKTEWLTSLEELWEVAQQPRKWVGLTDDEISTIAFDTRYTGLVGTTRTIEAKLKEKNND
jgi:hypothetical protein